MLLLYVTQNRGGPELWRVCGVWDAERDVSGHPFCFSQTPFILLLLCAGSSRTNNKKLYCPQKSAERKKKESVTFLAKEVTFLASMAKEHAEYAAVASRPSVPFRTELTRQDRLYFNVCRTMVGIVVLSLTALNTSSCPPQSSLRMSTLSRSSAPPTSAGTIHALDERRYAR